MQTLRTFILLAVAALGVAIAADVVVEAGVKWELSAGVAVAIAALGAAATVFELIRSGRLPVRTWYVVPVIVGVGFGVLGAFNLRGWLTGVSGAGLGIGAALVCFAGLQYWADRRGAQDWAGIIGLGVLMLANAVFGLIFWIAR